jgi:hypothetical protein
LLHPWDCPAPPKASLWRICPADPAG